MDTENVNHLSEARQFARTLFYNIRLYYLQKKSNMNGEFVSCKLYSNYCHAVIIHYLELNYSIFDEVEETYAQIGSNPHLIELIEIQYEKWQKLEEFPSDSEFYVHFAKSAILALFGSFYDTTRIDVYEEKICQFAEKAIAERVLFENYDIARSKWKAMVNAIYKWYEKDLVHFATEPDIKHGWDKNGELLTNSENYLNSNGLILLSDWQRKEYYKEMDTSKFVAVINHMYNLSFNDGNVAESQITEFILTTSLLSIHCCMHCNFSKAAELVVDILNRLIHLN